MQKQNLLIEADFSNACYKSRRDTEAGTIPRIIKRTYLQETVTENDRFAEIFATQQKQSCAFLDPSTALTKTKRHNDCAKQHPSTLHNPRASIRKQKIRNYRACKCSQKRATI